MFADPFVSDINAVTPAFGGHDSTERTGWISSTETFGKWASFTSRTLVI